MSDVGAAIRLEREPVEGPRQTVELVRDEDVLSPSLQHALEDVGTAVGVVAAVALLFMQLPRAGRLLERLRATTQAGKESKR